jgi:hypothetical protein
MNVKEYAGKGLDGDQKRVWKELACFGSTMGRNTLCQNGDLVSK